MTIRDLVKTCDHMTTDTIFYVKMPEDDQFCGTIVDLPACATSINITRWSVLDYNPRSRHIDKVIADAKEYNYASLKTKVSVL